MILLYLLSHTPATAANGSHELSSCHSYSALLAIYKLFSRPHSFAIKANVISIPALTPEDVKYLPSSTHRAFAIHSTFRRIAFYKPKYSLIRCRLASVEQSRLASNKLPVHTVATIRDASASRFSSARNCGLAVSFQVPIPPGMSSTSNPPEPAMAASATPHIRTNW